MSRSPSTLLLFPATVLFALAGCGGSTVVISSTSGDGGGGQTPADGGNAVIPDASAMTHDSSVETGPDASLDSSTPPPDTGAGDAEVADSSPIDGSTCPPGEILVDSEGCSPVGPNACTAGWTPVPNTNCCEQLTCQPLPAACGGTLTCECASTLCATGFMCSVDTAVGSTLYCGFYPP